MVLKMTQSIKLEVISRLPEKQLYSTPLLFVHGAYTAAWCWDEYFLPYFAQQGYASYAVSLRGHGNSSGNLYFASLADYVEDLAQISQTLKIPPILIGHSMGGMVIQKYLETYSWATAVILMASVPHLGLWLPSFRFGLAHPILSWQLYLMQYISWQFMTPLGMKNILFSKQVSDETIQKYFTRMQNESQRVLWDMLWLDLPKRDPCCSLPMLALGAKDDIIFPPSLIQWTAKKYGAPCYIFPHMAHAMMLEPHWQQVAEKILSWLSYPPSLLEEGKIEDHHC